MPARTKPAPPGVFDVRYAEAVIDFMGRGYSLTAFAGEIGVSRPTLDRWAKDHPTFARAVEKGQARRARVLEDRLLAASGGRAFDLHMEALKSAAPQDWRKGDAPMKAKASSGSRSGPPPAAVSLPDNGRD